MSENEKKPAEVAEPKKKVDGPLTTLRKQLAAKKPEAEPVPAAPPAEPPAAETTPTVTEPAATETSSSAADATVEVVVEETPTPKPRRCACGRKWSAPAPDQCPECGGDTREE